MNWKLILLGIILTMGLSWLPTLNGSYQSSTAILVGISLSILILILRIIYLLNAKMLERNEDDLLLTKVRKNTIKNNQIEKLIRIQDDLELSKNEIIKSNIENKIEATMDTATKALQNETITDKTDRTLMKIYKEFNGNIFILSKNEVCESFWCSPGGKQILELNLNLANNKTFLGIGKPKCKIERIFIQNTDPIGATKKAIDKQIDSSIKCYKVEEKDIGHLQFCDAVIFENYAVCETQVNNQIEPTEYKIIFKHSEVKKYQELYEMVKSKSKNLN